MTLDEFLKGSTDSNAEFGRQVGASEATISRLRNAKQEPSYDLMRRIRDATDGAVTPNDFFHPAADLAPDTPAPAPQPAGATA